MISNTDLLVFDSLDQKMSGSKGFSFSALEMFARCQQFLQLISAAFRSMEDSDSVQTGMNVRELQKVMGVATNNISAISQSTAPEEVDKQLHYSASLLFPIFLAMMIAQSQNVGLTGILLDNCGTSAHDCNSNSRAICTTEDDLRKSKLEMPLVEGMKNDLTEVVNTRLLDEGQFGCAIDCEGEVYLLPGACVFKPKQSSRPTARHRNGFESGAEFLREIAAYEVDRAYGGFAQVPTTMEATVATAALPDHNLKADYVVGSMQKWVESSCSSEDMGSGRFKTADVHAIGILDLLLYNCDRHEGNMLVTNAPTCGKAQLVPIDHGLCLPSFKHLGQAEFAWLYWRQAKIPFTSAESALISRLDGDRIAKILSDVGVADDAILTARIMVMVLQVTNLQNWNLHQMGKLVSKHFTAQQSKLEEFVDEATVKMDGLDPVVEHDQFMAHFNAVLNQHVQQSGAIGVGSAL